VHQGTQLSTPHLREFWEPLRYNSSDCPVRQRSNGYSAPMVVCREQLMRYSARRSQSRARRRTGHSTRPVRWRRHQKLQRPGDVAGAPDSVRCAMRQKPSPTVLLVVGAINTPNHHTSMHPSFQPSHLIQ
jgi:hypothetical protein